MTSTELTTLRLLPQRCKLCGTEHEGAAEAVCDQCLGPLEPVYSADRELPDRATIARRPPSLWRYKEWLPFDGEPVLSLDTGFTPLVEAPRLARRLGVARAWVKNDSVSHPSLSFKDRVVATAINAAHALGITTIGCASTGNLANAVAAHAARAGLEAWIFIPEDLEAAKIVGSAIYGPNLVRVRGHYDDVNRLCAQLADRFGWGIVNVNLRGYYGEGSKTIAFEIAEQLGWELPDRCVVPIASGSLYTKIAGGFAEWLALGLLEGELPKMNGAQAEGCAPVASAFAAGAEVCRPVKPDTIAKSLAIGNPADGPYALELARSSGGSVDDVSDEEIRAGIKLLAETTGIFTETAGGVTTAVLAKLAERGDIDPHERVVLVITGEGLKTLDAVRGTFQTCTIEPTVEAFDASASAPVAA